MAKLSVSQTCIAAVLSGLVCSPSFAQVEHDVRVEAPHLSAYFSQGNLKPRGIHSALFVEDTPLRAQIASPSNAQAYPPATPFNVEQYPRGAFGNYSRAKKTSDHPILSLVNRFYVEGKNGEFFGATGIVFSCPFG